jgi:hypothetical protein
MLIVDKLKKLFFGRSAEPNEGMQVQRLHHQEGQVNLGAIDDAAPQVSEYQAAAAGVRSDFVERSTPALEEAKCHSSEQQTIGDLQTKPLCAWGEAALISGLKFHATMQLRTPLRVLLRHGELHTDQSAPPPTIIQSPWEGIWVPKSRTFRELGIDLEEMSESTSASDIGPVLPSQFVPFLVAVRRNQEDGSLTINEKISRVSELRKVPEFSGFVAAYGGSDELINRLFPRVITSIDGLSVTVKNALIDAGFTSVERIEQVSDDELLALNGMGAVRLAKLRAFCSKYAGDKTAERFAAD